MINRSLFSPNSSIAGIAALTLLLSINACGTDGASTDQSPPRADDVEKANNPILTQLGGGLDTDVVLDARVRRWTDTSERIIIDYDLSNNSDTEIIVLGYTHALQTDRKPDGTVRLFKGKQDTGNADFESTPIINGELLGPAASLRGSGSRLLPLKIDYPIDFNSAVDPTLDSFEFCIGYGLADELLPTRRDDGSYLLNQHLELQRFSCVNLNKPSEQSMHSESVLSDGQWRNILDSVLEIVNDDAIYWVGQTIEILQYPEDNADVLDISLFSSVDGMGGGSETTVRCDNDGHFRLLESTAAVGQLFIHAKDCLIGSTTIDGDVTRSKSMNEFGIESVVETMTNVTVQTATVLVKVSAGTFEKDDGHPQSTTILRDMTYYVEEGNQTRSMSDVNLQTDDFWGTAHDRSVNGNIFVRAPWTAEQDMMVTLTGLSGLPVNSTREFTAGQIELVTLQGDRLLFEAESGQGGSDTAMITLELGSSVTTHLVPWTELFQ